MSFRTGGGSAIAALLLLSLSLTGAVTAREDGGRTGADAIRIEGREATYPYVMRGKVRLLFFWVGKDDVGGGTIKVADDATIDGSERRERIEILFGSNPERVPGGHNRWGYAFETATWRDRQNEAPYLEHSLLEGFMRRSNEESLSEVTAKGEAEEGLFWFTGTRSEVTPSGATAEIRYFSSKENFDYRRADPIREGYQRRLAEGPPDKRRELDNRISYEAPYGFLSATRRLLNETVAAFQSGDARVRKTRPSLTYVYNAKLYRLTVEDLDYAESFRLDTPKADGARASLTIKDVAHVSFRIRRLDSEYEHDFTVSIPLGGALAGVPVRIVDKPRWWLRVELDLAPDEATRAALDGEPAPRAGGS